MPASATMLDEPVTIQCRGQRWYTMFASALTAQPTRKTRQAVEQEGPRRRRLTRPTVVLLCVSIALALVLGEGAVRFIIFSGAFPDLARSFARVIGNT